MFQYILQNKAISFSTDHAMATETSLQQEIKCFGVLNTIS